LRGVIEVTLDLEVGRGDPIAADATARVPVTLRVARRRQ
jgi:hypothetical protein